MSPFIPDWSLQQKGTSDQRRHQAKVQEALKRQLGDLVTEESILTSERGHRVKIPIRSLQQFKFRFDPWQGERVGQGQGSAKPGDVLGRLPERAAGSGNDGPAGDTPGVDYFEAEISIEDVEDMLFRELGLPYLESKPEARVVQPQWVFKDIARRGLMGNLDKRRSLKANLLRHAKAGKIAVGGWAPEDLRFKTWIPEEVQEHNAVVVAMRDISGSMGDFKKKMARMFAFWMLRFLRSQYQSVDVVFLVHHTGAREVSEQEFFELGESGGTKVSSVYELCEEVVRQRYPAAYWNIYPIHFSDGDNWSDADNRRTVESIRRLLSVSNVLGYAEIREGGYSSTLMSQFSKIQHPRFKIVTITKREDLYPALKAFFPRTDGGESGA